MTGDPASALAAAHPALEPRYFVRMASALGDKARILPHVRPGHVVDAGAGGGELAGMLAQLPDVTVTALDLAEESLARLRASAGVAGFEGSSKGSPTGGARFAVRRRELGADTDPLTSKPASTIVFSAVLHEVFSYARDPWAALERALVQARATLAPGGVVIVRDGVMPERPGEPAELLGRDHELLERYLALSPFAETRLEPVRPGVWAGTRHAVSEALCTLTWGADSLPREALERFQLATLDGYAELLERAGLHVVHREATTQPGYREHLRAAGWRASGPDGDWFPPTTGLWVAEVAA
ncbi:methyltransferase domain-containing protein [Schumannella sp. 10F1B-5-1]|uniref:methyltransferase domain-containing protein n=1 Tax=Schumannella sp. 10F1B-5-1 TaxID=2590780 RepID=UPI001130862E|nr:methyltransferase domain-containing protein [Schumannella sp. 10F1B-5-1]TPW73007.1 methyltransferase domain-containing protein [Schumannella sp. 10F1B-5-1]